MVYNQADGLDYFKSTTTLHFPVRDAVTQTPQSLWTPMQVYLENITLL